MVAHSGRTVPPRRSDAVTAGLRVLQRDGIDNLSLRAVATQLEISPFALSQQFVSTQALLDAMADRIIVGVDSPAPGAEWDVQIRGLAWRLRTACLAYRDGARVLIGSYVLEPHTLAGRSDVVERLRHAGASVEHANWVILSLAHFALGHTVEEQAMGDRSPETWARQRGAPRSEGEVAMRSVDAGFGPSSKSRFAFGLDALLHGVSMRLRYANDAPVSPGQSQLHTRHLS